MDNEIKNYKGNKYKGNPRTQNRGITENRVAMMTRDK